MPMRFVAGAVCPQCGEQDTLQLDTDAPEGQPYRACVECGFTEEGSEESASPAVPGARFDQQPGNDDRQVVRILPDSKRTLH